MTENEIYLRSEAEKNLREAEYQRKRAQRFERRAKNLERLVLDMSEAFIHGNCYRWCEYYPEPCDGECQYLRRIRELGIVDDRDEGTRGKSDVR